MVYLYQYVALCHLQLLHIKAHWTLFNIDVNFNRTSYTANAQYVNEKGGGQDKFCYQFHISVMGTITC